MKTGQLRNFLRTRDRDNVLGKTIAHMQKVLECVVEFERGFTFFTIENNSKLAKDVFNRVEVLEHEADIIRRDLLLVITAGDIAPQIREDLGTLVRTIDRIANATNGAARRLINIDEESIRSLGDKILQEILETIHISVEAAKILYNLIKNYVTMENKEVFRNTEQIQVLEHRCDVIHSEIYAELNKIKQVSFNPFMAIEIANFINLVEEISDKVEDVADFIELIKTAMR